MKYYPINLNISGRKCIVIGGGNVAERKILSLLECGADVTVISPSLTKNIKRLVDEYRINFIKRNYKKGDLKGAFIVVAATNDSKVNKEVAKEAKKKKVMINVVDSPKLCDFISPSVIRRGDLVISISTGGKFPAFSKKIRIMLEKIIGKEYGMELDRLVIFREKFKKQKFHHSKN